MVCTSATVKSGLHLIAPLSTLGFYDFLGNASSNILALPLLSKLYPSARYVVLTRHPMALLHSCAYGLFAGDYGRVDRENPYIPAIAAFIATPPARFLHVRYEDLLRDPNSHIERLCDFLGIPVNPSMMHASTYPVLERADRWRSDFSARPDALACGYAVLETLGTQDLQMWGNAKAGIVRELAECAGNKKARPSYSRFTGVFLKRRIFLGFHRMVRVLRCQKMVVWVRDLCVMLLRD